MFARFNLRLKFLKFLVQSLGLLGITRGEQLLAEQSLAVIEGRDLTFQGGNFLAGSSHLLACFFSGLFVFRGSSTPVCIVGCERIAFFFNPSQIIAVVGRIKGGPALFDLDDIVRDAADKMAVVAREQNRAGILF